MSRPIIPALTGVRALAALLVFFSHFPPPVGDGPGGRWFTSVMREGHIGVTIFFVLSGFVIAYRHFGKSELSGQWLSKYFRARVARIYPVYALLTLLTFYVTRSTAWNELLANLTLTRGLFNAIKFGAIPQGWSLTVEECFYFSAPVIFYFIARKRGWIPFLAIPLIGLALVQLGLPGTFMENVPFALIYTFFGRFLEFFLGIGLALLVLDKKIAPKAYAGAASLPLMTWIGCFGIGASMVVLAALPSDPRIAHAVGQGGGLGLFSPAGIALNHFILPVFIVLFYAGLIQERSLIQRVLGSRTLVLLGQSSYCFYLIHYGVIHNALSARAQLSYGAALASLTLISIAAFKWVEEPLNHLIRGKAASLPAGYFVMLNPQSKRASEPRKDPAPRQAPAARPPELGI